MPRRSSDGLRAPAFPMPTATTMLLEIQNLKKCYRAPDGGDSVDVLCDLELKIDAGESVAIVGPSGCGKSTLLNIIGALDRVDAGTVQVAGRDIAGLDEKALAAFRNETVGFIFQLHHLLPQCTILENVLVPTLAQPGATAKARERAEKLLAAVGAWIGPVNILLVFILKDLIGLLLVLAQATYQGRLRTLLKNSTVVALNLVHLREVGLQTVQQVGLSCKSVDKPLPMAVPVLVAVGLLLCIHTGGI